VDIVNKVYLNMKSKPSGFTLIEMSIALVIFSLMVGAVLGVGNAQISSSKISATKQKQEAIKLALINYVMRNNRMPCPAVAELAPGVFGYGVEDNAALGCVNTSINIAGTVATGIIPWVSLGLTDEVATDGYYHRYTYQVALTATKTTPQTISGLRGAISTHTATPTVAAPAAGNNQSNNCTPAGNNYNPCSAVAVILSHGNNGFGAYTKDGARIALPIGADELANTDNDSLFLIKDFSDNLANPFDDLLLPLTSSDLLTPLTIHGTLQDYMASINQDFTDIKSAIIADSIANRFCAESLYRYQMPILLPALSGNTAKDPWGSLYTYNRDYAPPIDSSANPSHPAFTLISIGPDGESGSNDDIKNEITINQLQEAFIKAGLTC
jgi:prepilin-type N-terminal cleavage/methylation domain-containing protein